MSSLCDVVVVTRRELPVPTVSNPDRVHDEGLGYSRAMDNAWMDMAAGKALGIGLVAVGVVVVALLLGAFWAGARARRRQPPPPRPDEQPRMPEGGPVREEREHRESDEVPQDGRRRTPHEMTSSSTPVDPTEQERREN